MIICPYRKNICENLLFLRENLLILRLEKLIP